MAQKTQSKKRVCNTIADPDNSGKARCWTFTLNNYTEDEVNHIQGLDCLYVFQEETGEKGTKHLQGLLVYKNAISFASVKKKIIRAHIEKCKNKNASIRYCTKEESRTGMLYTNMTDKSYFGTNDTSITCQNKVEKFEDQKRINRKKAFDEMNLDDIWHLMYSGKFMDLEE